MSETTTAATGSAVRDTLTAAGHSEWVRGTVSGFHIGEGDTEVLVEYLPGADTGGSYAEPALAKLDAYERTLRRSGLHCTRAWATHGAFMIVIPKPGYYADERGMIRRQHDVYGGPHDEPLAGQ